LTHEGDVRSTNYYTQHFIPWQKSWEWTTRRSFPISAAKEVRMQSGTVKASELGLNCWLPIRLLKQCYRCQRYEICKYPERVASPEFDELTRKYNNRRIDAVVALAKVKKMSGGRTPPAMSEPR
jgi:hypothetical protein